MGREAFHILGHSDRLAGHCAHQAAAPLIGLGHGRDFLLLQLFDREPVFKTVLALAWLLCTYQALSIGITAMPRSAKWRAVLQAAWIEGTTTFTQLSGQPTGSIRNRQWQQVIILAAFAVAIVFAIFLSKFLIDFEESTDQVWYQTFCRL